MFHKKHYSTDSCVSGFSTKLQTQTESTKVEFQEWSAAMQA